MANTLLKLSKKAYDSSTDDVPGKITFDNTTGNIILDGQEWGKFSTMEVTNVLDENTTPQQIPNAKLIYEYLKRCAYIDTDSVATDQTPTPSLVYAPSVVEDNENTDIELNTLNANTVYIWNEPLTNLTVHNVVDSALESTLYFTVGDNFSYTFPQGMMKTKPITFVEGSSYVVSIKNLVITSDTVDSVIQGEPILFSSEQLESGILEVPSIVESFSTTPVIAHFKPNTIYKFGEITSLTINDVTANTLESVMYFTAGETSFTAELNSEIGLKIASTSSLTFQNGNFCIAIKDGVITTSRLNNL